MRTRRFVIAGSASLALAGRPADAAPDPFDQLVQDIENHPDLTAAASQEKEGAQAQFELRTDRGYMEAVRAFAPRLAASKKTISPSAIRLIVACEVSGQKAYERLYQKPVWPGANSGVTIGVGYDLSFIQPDWLHEDWDALLDKPTIKVLESACRLKGAEANDFCAKHRTLQVPWAVAFGQFEQKLLPRYITETLLALPTAEKLSGDSLGALVSLVYNRGPSFRRRGARYREMGEIYFALKNNNAQAVPDAIERMGRLWPNLPGLVKRRRAEAALFRRGLVA